MTGKYLIFVAFISFLAVKETHGQNLTNNYLFSQSFPNLYKQVILVLQNTQTLVYNSTLANTQKNLMLAKNMILTMSSKISQLTGSSSTNSSSNSSSSSSSGGNIATNVANKTISTILSIVKKVQNQATGKGVDVSSCTNGTVSKIMSLGIDAGARVAACPVDEATKAITMINTNIAYVSELTNLTLYAPQALNNCLNTGNITTQASCVNSYMQSTATKLITAPGKLTSMVNDAYAYVSIFPTNVAVCATNSTFTSVSNAANLALNITTCIAAKFLSS